MGVSCCERFVNVAFLLVNVIWGLAAVVFTTIGVRYLMEPSLEQEVRLIKDTTDNLLVYCVIIFGSLWFLASGLGILAAWLHSPRMLRCYCALVWALMTVMVLVHLTALLRPNPNLVTNLALTMHHYGNRSKVTELWDELQQKSECCGTTGYSDWLQLDRLSLPISCCKQMAPGCWKVGDFLHKIHETGCLAARLNFLPTWKALLAGVGAYLLASQLLACCFWCSLTGDIHSEPRFRSSRNASSARPLLAPAATAAQLSELLAAAAPSHQHSLNTDRDDKSTRQTRLSAPAGKGDQIPHMTNNQDTRVEQRQGKLEEGQNSYYADQLLCSREARSVEQMSHDRGDSWEVEEQVDQRTHNWRTPADCPAAGEGPFQPTGIYSKGAVESITDPMALYDGHDGFPGPEWADAMDKPTAAEAREEREPKMLTHGNAVPGLGAYGSGFEHNMISCVNGSLLYAKAGKKKQLKKGGIGFRETDSLAASCKTSPPARRLM